MGHKDKVYRLNIDQIIKSLSEVQTRWSEISLQLTVKREYPTDEIIQNMALAYRYLDFLLANKIKVFSDEGISHLLELNLLVLCGADPQVRREYHHFIEQTKKRFFQNIQPIKRWYKKHKDSSSIKVAAQVYVGVLSRPQLFFEGNHRTGALIASEILLRDRRYPFVLNVDNAVSYFEPSSQIKYSDKRSIKGRWKLPKYQKEFEKFLKEKLTPDCVL